MCNLTAPPPNRPAAKRHNCGTPAARWRSRTAPSAPPPRTKSSTISNLCAPTCGIFSSAGTGWPQMAVFFDLKSLRNCPLRLKNLLILATCFMHHFPCPKFYLGLPFSPPGLARLPFLFPKVQLGNQQKARWGGRLARHLGAPGAPRIFAPLLCSLPPWRELNLSRHSLPPETPVAVSP